MGVVDQWNSLTPAEKAVLTALTAKNPAAPLILKNSKEKAFNETKAKFGSNGHNDKSDAFRHCFWSAILSRDLGYFEAKLFTDAHETNPAQPPAEKAMDLHNNSVGLKIGFYYVVPDSDKAISHQCYRALQDGKLKVISP